MRSCFTGILVQDRDTQVETVADLKVVTKREPTEKEKERFTYGCRRDKTS